MKHIIPISGKDSLVTALIQSANEPDRDYEYIFNDTGCELPETYQWLDKVENQTGFKIKRIGKDLINVIYEQGILPSVKTRFWYRIAKIKPMEVYIGKKEQFTLYLGLRADEPQRVGYQGSSRAIVKFPLRDTGITLPAVFTILEAKGLLPPDFFWQKLYNLVDLEIRNRLPLVLNTNTYNWADFISKYEFRQLFAGRSRSNCFNCFFKDFRNGYGYMKLIQIFLRKL